MIVIFVPGGIVDGAKRLVRRFSAGGGGGGATAATPHPAE